MLDEKPNEQVKKAGDEEQDGQDDDDEENRRADSVAGRWWRRRRRENWVSVKRWWVRKGTVFLLNCESNPGHLCKDLKFKIQETETETKQQQQLLVKWRNKKKGLSLTSRETEITQTLTQKPIQVLRKS